MLGKTYLLTTAVAYALVLTVPAHAAGHGEWEAVRMQLAANDGHKHDGDEHKHTKDGDHHDHSKSHGHEDHAHFDAKKFSTVKEAWNYLTTATADAQQKLETGDIEPVHELAEHIGSAVHTLEDKSEAAGDDTKDKLAAVLKQLDKAADELHHAAESKDKDATALGLKKVQGLLPVLKGLYPSGTL